MAINKDELAQRVGVALLYNVVQERKPQIQALLRQHGYTPAADDEDLLYQVVQISNERGPLFDPDLSKEVKAAGYYGADDITGCAIKISDAAAGNFSLDPASLATDVSKKGIQNLGKLIDTVKNLKSQPKADADGKKIKLKDRLKAVFSKKDSSVTKDELASNGDAKKIAKDAGAPDDEKSKSSSGSNTPDDDDDDDDDDKKKPAQKILGMTVPVFIGVAFIFVLIVIVLIVLIKRAKDAKKKKSSE